MPRLTPSHTVDIKTYSEDSTNDLGEPTHSETTADSDVPLEFDDESTVLRRSEGGEYTDEPAVATVPAGTAVEEGHWIAHTDLPQLEVVGIDEVRGPGRQVIKYVLELERIDK